ncbi:MAG: hypothetical protein SGJ20_02205 [Planctomycetota bacterium]|nr:hypothetical protein [Planctomycetota bacterium]
MATLYTITVDTEEEWKWSSGWPTQEYSLKNIAGLARFQQVCADFGARATYFTNHAVLDDTTACETMLALAERSDTEIGMHIHPWNTPPLNGLPGGARESFLLNLPEPTIQAKLQTVYDSFLRNNLRPTSFRGGRYSSGGAIHQFLRKHGFLADASVVPYTTWSDAGAPDYLNRDVYPVRLPPTVPGEKPLWEIPLTLGFTRRPFGLWSKFYNCVQSSGLNRLRLIGLAEKLGVVRKVWLNFENSLGEGLVQFLQLIRSMQLPCVCFTLHSSSLIAGGNEYTPTATALERVYERVDQALKLLSGWNEFQPATVSEVALHLERLSNAHSRN